jgi:hypothetical protein
VDDGVAGLLGENAAQAVGIREIQGTQPLRVDSVAAPALEIVNHRYVITLLQEQVHHVRADVTRAAGHQNPSLHHTRL